MPPFFLSIPAGKLCHSVSLSNFSGDFVFAISSADGSELWLSTDDDPKHSRKIAYLGDVRLPRYYKLREGNVKNS